MEPVIIGALILDVHAKPSTAPISGTTVPGQVLNWGSLSLSFVSLVLHFSCPIMCAIGQNLLIVPLIFLKAGLVNHLLTPSVTIRLSSISWAKISEANLNKGSLYLSFIGLVYTGWCSKKCS